VIRYGFHYTERFSEEGFWAKQSEGIFRVSELIFSNSFLLVFLFLLGVAGLARRDFLRRTHYFPLFALYWVVSDFFAASLSGMFFLHYYLQMIPSILLLSASGLFFFWRWMVRQPSRVQWTSLSVLFFFALIDFTLPGMLLDRPDLPVERTEDKVLTYLEEHREADSTLWVTNGYQARYYLQTRMTSPTRYLAIFDHHLQLGSTSDTDPEKIGEIHSDLMANPPGFIVGHEIIEGPLYRKDFLEWLEPRYAVDSIGGELESTLVFQRVEDASQSLAEQKKDWAFQEAQSPHPFIDSRDVLFKRLRGSAPQSF